jgi:hypothetical protein
VPDFSRVNRRIAWCLVRLYPPQFRRDVGLGLADAIEDRLRDRCAAGAPLVRATMPVVVDTLRNAPIEWIHALASPRPPDPHPTPGGRSVIDRLAQDVRYALRLWKRRPLFAAVAILTLALGIGANTAMFTIVNAVLLRPLPYAHADRLVSVWGRTAAYPRGLISYDEYDEIRKQTGTFDAMALWFPQSVNLTGVEEPQRLVGSFVTGSFFDVLGLKAERGRERARHGEARRRHLAADVAAAVQRRRIRDRRDDDAQRRAADDRRRARAAVRSRDGRRRRLLSERRRVHPGGRVSGAARVARRRTR